jgi:hypothetical protein
MTAVWVDEETRPPKLTTMENAVGIKLERVLKRGRTKCRVDQQLASDCVNLERRLSVFSSDCIVTSLYLVRVILDVTSCHLIIKGSDETTRSDLP